MINCRTTVINSLGFRAMNGLGPAEPAWWINLQSHPDATVTLPDGLRAVRARAAAGDERSGLWDRWRELDKNLDGYADHERDDGAEQGKCRGADGQSRCG